MNTKWIFALFGLLVLGSVVFAISGATVLAEAKQARWVGGTAGNVTTEGGNVSQVNLSVSSLTDRWAAFYGNVTGSIVLRDNTNTTARVYEWATWDPAGGGEVCTSEGSAFNFVAAAAATGADINTDYTLGNAADNATNTLVDASACNLQFATSSVATSAYVKHTDGQFWTCAISNGATGAKADYAFCTNISASGTGFKNQPAMYEVMVPTTPGTGTETYFFYAELN